MRWVCPICKAGKLGPGKMRRDDVRAYCLPCSEDTGKLVARTSPARERRAVLRATARAERRDRDREARRAAWEATQAAERHLRAMPVAALLGATSEDRIREIARRWSALAAWEVPIRMELKIRYSRRHTFSTGRAWPASRGVGRVVVTVGSNVADAYATLLHEIAHVAAGPRENHGGFWRSLFLAAAAEVGARPVVEGIDKWSIQTAVRNALALRLAECAKEG